MKRNFSENMKKNFWKSLLMAVGIVFFLSFAAMTGKAAGDTYTVSVDSGYLALRNAKAYDASNEIGKLYTGDTVEVTDYSDSTYWYVYSPKYGKYGYVNRQYLKGSGNTETSDEAGIYTVRVDSGYLALRNAKAYDASNEIGKLYTGDTVEVIDGRDSAYWYVYSPKLDQYGYVNKDYLESGSSFYMVQVDSGYLALRNAKAYDAANEIGELYTGDIVQVLDTTDDTYWYVYSPKYEQYGYVNGEYLRNTRIISGYYSVAVDSGYLALRNAKAYDASNEIGKLYTGDTVEVLDTSDSAYWYVYAPKLSQYGYVNKDYLKGLDTSKVSEASVYSVRVDSGYLALRNAKAYDASNEIGKLYTGDTVEVLDTRDTTYWYVYSSKYDQYGYVNHKYLF